MASSAPRPLKKSVRLEVSEDGTEEVKRERNLNSSSRLIQDSMYLSTIKTEVGGIQKDHLAVDLLLSVARNETVVTSEPGFRYQPQISDPMLVEPLSADLDDGVVVELENSTKVGKEAGFPYSPPSTKGRPRKHPFKEGKYKCHLCGISCTKPSVLEKHVRAHTNERPFPCPTCNLFFKTKSNLYKHLKSKMHQLRGKSDSDLNNITHDEGIYFEEENHSVSLDDSESTGENGDKKAFSSSTPTVSRTSSLATNQVNPYQQFPSFESGFESSGSRMASIETVYSQRRLSRQDSFDYGQLSTANTTVVNSQGNPSLGSLISDVNSAGAQFSLKHTANQPSAQRPLNYVSTGESPQLVINNLLASQQQVADTNSNKQVTLSNTQLSNLAEILRILTDAACNTSQPDSQNNMNQMSMPQNIQVSAGYSVKAEPSAPLPFTLPMTVISTASTNNATATLLSQLQAVQASQQPLVLQQPPIISQHTAIPITVPNNLSLLQVLQQHQEQQRNQQMTQQLLNHFISNINQSQQQQSQPIATQSLISVNQNAPGVSTTNQSRDNMTVGVLTLKQGPGSVQVPVQIDSQLINMIAENQSTSGTNYPPTVQLNSILNAISLQQPSSSSRSSQEMAAAQSILEMASKQQQQQQAGLPRSLQTMLLQAPAVPSQSSHVAFPTPNLTSADFLSNSAAKKKAPKLQIVGKSSSFDVECPVYGSVNNIPRQAFSLDTSEPEKASSVKDRLKNHILKRSFSLERSNSMLADISKIECKVEDATIPFKKRKLGHSMDQGSLEQGALLPQMYQVGSDSGVKLQEQLSSAHNVASLRYSTKETYCLVSQPSVPGIKSEYAITPDQKLGDQQLLQFSNQNTLLTKLPDGTCILQPVKVLSSPSVPVSITPTQQQSEVRIFKGGLLSHDGGDMYVRGRGRGRYKCEQCGIRCTKPSMLRKHIRSHTDIRPYICRHCNFSFKTKGNLTKHMKSKQHLMKCMSLGMQEAEVPKTIEESTQVDQVALEKQLELVKQGKLDPRELEKDDSMADVSDEEEEEEEESTAKDMIQTYNKQVDDSVQQNLDLIKSAERRRLQAGEKVRSPSQILQNLSRTSREMKNILNKAASISVADVSSISAPVVNVETMVQEKPVNLSAGKSLVPTSSGGHGDMPAIVHSAIDSMNRKTPSPPKEPLSGMACLENDRPAHSSSAHQPSATSVSTNNNTGEPPLEFPSEKKCKECGRSFDQPAQLSLHLKTHLFATETGSADGDTGSETDNPRPFTCSVCPRGFRVSGHLAKHFRSKQHLRALVAAGRLSESLFSSIDTRRLPLQEIVDQDSGEVLTDVVHTLLQAEPSETIDLDANEASDVDVD